MTTGHLEIAPAIHDAIGCDGARELIRVHQQARPGCSDCGRPITAGMDAAVVVAVDGSVTTLRFRHAACGASVVTAGPPPPTSALDNIEWRTVSADEQPLLIVEVGGCVWVAHQPVGEVMLAVYERAGFTRPRKRLLDLADMEGAPVAAVTLGWAAEENTYGLLAQRPVIDDFPPPGGALEIFHGLENDVLWLSLAAAAPVWVVIGARMTLDYPGSVDAALLDGAAVAARVVFAPRRT